MIQHSAKSTSLVFSGPSLPTYPTISTKARRPVPKSRGKKRSSRACVTCRSRKVRCDIIQHGAPCRNCRLDEIDCVLATIKRHPSAQKERNEDKSCYDNKDLAPSHDPILRVLAPHLFQSPEPIYQPIGAAANLANKFTPFPNHVDICALTYLHTKGALSTPSKSLQTKILEGYIRFVHSTMPILDLEEFLGVVNGGDIGIALNKNRKFVEIGERKTVAFLLFQAVMFAGVGYTSVETLKEEGFASRESALRIFFGRISLLYDFDTTADHLSIIQSLFLMTLHPAASSFADPRGKNAAHFLTIAISLSFSFGLNRNTTTSYDSRQKRLERRIWWILFIRDRVLPLDPDSQPAGNLLRIARADCNVEMLCLSDFDLKDVKDGRWGLQEMQNLRDAEECVQKARLCWCSDDRLICNFSNPYFLHLAPSWPAQNIRAELPHLSGREDQIYASRTISLTSSTPFKMSVLGGFEEIDYLIASCESTTYY